MPNDDACIIYCDAETFQTHVLMMNNNVHFLNDGDCHYSIGKKTGKDENPNTIPLTLAPKLLTKRGTRCYYCRMYNLSQYARRTPK